MESKVDTPRSSGDSEADELARLIIRSRLALGDKRTYSDDETEEMAVEWALCLDRSLPLGRLEDCYSLAMRTRDSDWPLAVTDLNEAWRLIRGEESRPGPPPCPGCEFEAEGGRPCRFHPGRLQTEADGVR